jgi:hypothetical protein
VCDSAEKELVEDLIWVVREPGKCCYSGDFLIPGNSRPVNQREKM